MRAMKVVTPDPPMPDAVVTQPAALASARQAKPAALRPFGRFGLKQLLGRSSLTMAWEAVDLRIKQNVLLMMPRRAPADVDSLRRWLAEAQRASKLNHPHLLMPVEVAHHQGWPYVVCERPQGVLTLSEHLNGRHPPAPLDVAGWCADVLDGLAFAHDAGVVHGDMGTHALVLDRHGRVCAWGLSAATSEAASLAQVGTAGHLQQVRAAGERDVTAVGLLLYQWLSRQPVFDEPDLPTANDRLGDEIARLPWSLPHPVPEALRAIVNRSIDRHSQRRYVGARSFERALQGWRKVQSSDTGGPLALLLDRLRTVGHLPALPGLAQRVVQVARMEKQRIDTLADVILQDPALSFELLRAVNSAELGALQDGAVTTVRRAIQLIGLTGVRRAASVLRSWPGPLREEGAAALLVGMRRSWLAGHIAELIAPGGLDAESALLAAQLQHLGRLLVLYHFPDEAAQIRTLMQATPARTPDETAVPGLSEEAAAMAVLGVDLQSLALAMAKHWGLGDTVQEMMQPLPLRQTVHTPDGTQAWVRLVASCANEMLAAWEGPTSLQTKTYTLIAARYHKALGLTLDEIREVLEKAQQLLAEHFQPKMPG
jgi:HD-like signal output (HDOD) protein